MRKLAVGMRFRECGKDRGTFKIVRLINRLGKAETSKGTMISTNRLKSTKHYKVVG